MTTVLLAVGDASGDVYAADFVDALRALRPDAHFAGVGGVEMETALAELRPDLAVLVDSSGFNLPFARRARRAGVPTFYYVAPQVWAWRRGRIRRLARWVDRMALILPFEPAVYAGTGIRAEFVGHPLLERLADGSGDRAAARAGLGLPAAARVVALLPGSRRNELRHCLGVQLAAARCLHDRDPACRFVLPLAPSVERAALEASQRRARLPSALTLALCHGGARAALAACDVAVCKPGTATLEAALLGRPCVVAGRAHPLSAAVVRRLVKLDFWALPNLIAGEAIVPELLQEQAEPQAIAEAVRELFDGPPRAAQLAGLAEVRAALGSAGAARRAAAIAEEMIVARARA
jgi:lipid-A-disaccharide synthase